MNNRKFEMTLALPCKVEDAWACLSSAQGIANWFAPSVEMQPGEGGHITTKWTDYVQFTEAIVGWEPNRLLRTVWGEAGGPDETVVEFTLEPAAEGTRLHLVHSGFGPEAKWDDFFDSISRGWTYELQSMRHYLSRHKGERRRMLFHWYTTDRSLEQVWEIVLESNCLGLSALVGVSPGGGFSMVDPTGRPMSGTAMIVNLPTDFAGVWSELNDALFRFQLDRSSERPGMINVCLSVSAYDVDESRMDELDSALTDRLSSEFPAQVLA